MWRNSGFYFGFGGVSVGELASHDANVSGDRVGDGEAFKWFLRRRGADLWVNSEHEPRAPRVGVSCLSCRMFLEEVRKRRVDVAQ